MPKRFLLQRQSTASEEAVSSAGQFVFSHPFLPPRNNSNANFFFFLRKR